LPGDAMGCAGTAGVDPVVAAHPVGLRKNQTTLSQA
jgi:hypothetical protein